VEADYRTAYTPAVDEPVELVSCPYFTTSVYDLTEEMTVDYSDLDSFVIFICIEGRCTVTDDQGESVSLQAGESLLMPATTKDVHVVPQGKVKFLETWV
jgi:mannose-6-phosphate isomerase